MDAKKLIMDDQTAQEEPQVIAEIHVNQISHREQFVLEYTTCCLCGTELEFTHVTNFSHQEVIEEAYCPSCNIRAKKESHGLQ